MHDDPSIPGATAKLDMFWLALAQGRQEDVGKYLSRAGYDNLFDAIRDLHEDVLWSAQDLRERLEIEPALEMEKLAAEIAGFLTPN